MAAQAKGPSAASITGPGLFSPITVDAVDGIAAGAFAAGTAGLVLVRRRRRS